MASVLAQPSDVRKVEALSAGEAMMSVPPPNIGCYGHRFTFFCCLQTQRRGLPLPGVRVGKCEVGRPVR